MRPRTEAKSRAARSGGPASIYLIGLPASGKSTVGRQLALVLGYRFIDSDALVLDLVSELRPAISDVLTLYRDLSDGEFREYEYKVLHAAVRQESGIVATGGGFVDYEPSFRLLLGCPSVVFLDCRLDVLTDRISGMAPRPMFHGTSIAGKLTELSNRRRSKYLRLATLAVDAGLPAREVASAIVSGLLRCE